MKRIAIALVFFLLATTVSAGEIRGAWTATTSDEDAGKIYFQLNRKHSNNGRTMRVADFKGLAASQINAAAQTPVTFALSREAGTIQFEGVFKAGLGAGQFSFSPNRAYLDTIRSLGVPLEGSSDETRRSRPRHRPRSDREMTEDEMLFHYAMQDVSTSYIRAMQAEGFRVTLPDYFTMSIHRVTPESVRELRTLGYNNISYEDIIATHIHRVTPAYIRELRAAGIKDLPLEELVGMRIHRVSPESIKEYAALGYTNLNHDQLMKMSIHRVTPEYIRELKDAGYSNIPVDKLVQMRIHRIDPEYIRKMNANQ